MQRTPSKITNPYLKWHISLDEIEAQIIQFTDLPTQTPALAQDITKKFGFIRNFLIHESGSYHSIPHDLLEIQQKLVELEAQFNYHSNLHRLDVEHEHVHGHEQEHEHEHEHEQEEHEQEQEEEHEHEHEQEQEHEDSEMGSVCESCLNNDGEFEEEGGSNDAWGVVHEGFDEMLRDYEVVVPQSLGEFRDTTMVVVPKNVEEKISCDCKREKTAKRRRRWWWRTVVTLMPASVVIMVVTYIDKKQREGFLVPT